MLSGALVLGRRVVKRVRSATRSSTGSPSRLSTPSNEIDRCGSPAAAVSDVCGRWTRDGLTVDPAPWNPGLKYGARRRKSYEGQGCAELHLGRGTTPRPDTLAQTGQITRKSCLRTGRAIRF